MLFDSVAPEVQTISSVSQPRSSASLCRESAIAASARLPMRWGLDGLPMNFSAASNQAWRAAGNSGVVALWSK